MFIRWVQVADLVHHHYLFSADKERTSFYLRPDIAGRLRRPVGRYERMSTVKEPFEGRNGVVYCIHRQECVIHVTM
jgi:hypothetical protein